MAVATLSTPLLLPNAWPSNKSLSISSTTTNSPSSLSLPLSTTASGRRAPARPLRAAKSDDAPTGVAVAYGRQSFPKDFVFGAASAAYQIEGAWNEGGKGKSIWDTFTEKPGNIHNGDDGKIACDSYHRYAEDVKLLKNMNMDAYRFSISWSRILPTGSRRRGGTVSQEGINYYNNLIDELLRNKIEPYVTLFHWDVPQKLQDEYGGFLNKNIVDDFKDFCDVCFEAFGNRVKHWITINEPWTFATQGYGRGLHAPGLRNPDKVIRLTDPYIVAHNILLAHAAAYRLYKLKYWAQQKGVVGITLVSLWFEPHSEDEHDDMLAQQRLLDFMLGWFMEPIWKGDYPFAMKSLVRERLPEFADSEKEALRRSFDFLGVNYYTTNYAMSLPYVYHQLADFNLLDASAYPTGMRREVDGNQIPIGEGNGSWVFVYPNGIRKLLVYIKNRFGDPDIYITENGISDVERGTKLTKEEALADYRRITYHAAHLTEIREAINQGANVKGYFAWSLTDNFEWEHGYSERFGLNYVDFESRERTRTPKSSAKWFANFLGPSPKA